MLALNSRVIDMNARLTPKNLSQAEELLEEFIRLFPLAFVNRACSPVRPLKLKIHEDLRQVLADRYSHKAIARAFSLYVNTPEYRQSLIQGAIRVDLSGQPCGEVTEQQVQLAQRPKDRYQRFVQRMQRAPQVAEKSLTLETIPLIHLKPSRLDLLIKITTLPQQSKVVTNGWHEFYVEADKRLVKITVRPKVWRKLQYAAANYPFWIAAIRGKKGENLECHGFELREPIVQIFTRNASEHEMARTSNVAPSTISVKKNYHLNSKPSLTTTLRIRNDK
jgi:ProQ/FINO family